ncbi:MAG: hypothetical protein DMG41_03060 [Acidobacteria bacterium]|nr:MAG: hypothetical protein DMG41_03060 [Acidobacteriota bacterium]
MRRDRALKVVLVLLGLLFVAAVYPMVGGVLHPDQSDTGDTMMASIYATLGVFLLLAVRNPRIAVSSPLPHGPALRTPLLCRS